MQCDLPQPGGEREGAREEVRPGSMLYVRPGQGVGRKEVGLRVKGRRPGVAQGHRQWSVAGAATFACYFAGNRSDWQVGDQPSWFPRRQDFQH